MIAGRNPTRVAIVDDHTLFAESLQVALSAEGYDARLGVGIGTGHSPGAVLTAVLAMEPGIVLLDLGLAGYGNGIRLISPLAQSGIAVIVVTGSPDRAVWGEALRNGARKVLSKGAHLDEILATVRKVRDGRPVISRGEREQLLEEWRRHHVQVHAARQRLELLTRRESEVLGQLMEGLQVGDIARRSVVSVATVRTQVKSILAKLEVTSQLAAVGLAHSAEWRAPVDVEVIPAQGVPSPHS